MFEKRGKNLNIRGQVTIFIIIAVVLVAGVLIYFLVRGGGEASSLPGEFQPVYNQFMACLENEARIGSEVLGSQGGHIDLPDYEPGSEHMPFSSQLEFMGISIPYWYYVSGNNIQRQQVPSLSSMEIQLEDFIEANIKACDFSEFNEMGFEITLPENVKADVEIEDEEIYVDLDLNLGIFRNDESVFVKNHKASVNSHLGKLYSSAREIYQQEQKDLFLEDYAVDVLRLYAPVDGVEFQCSPLVWNTEDVFEDLRSAIEANTAALKISGGDYDLQGEYDDYFLIDSEVDSDVGVRFLNSKNWPHTFEVNPSEGSMLVAKPVGNQEGLGILGFCYVPYHYVYNVKYPVLVQVFSGEEMFQFPFAVVLQGNMPREPVEGSQAVGDDFSELCEYKNSPFAVNVYDLQLNPIDAEISYECFGTVCDIGVAENGFVEGMFPQCVNGFVVAKAEGYEDTKQMVSTNVGGEVDILMDKLYKKQVRINLGGALYSKKALVSFLSEDAKSNTIIYPEQREVELSEGQYQIRVEIYREGSLSLQGTSSNQCVDSPQSGLGGLFGLTERKCFDIEIPAQVVSDVLAGGGTESYYVVEDELENGNVVEINANSLPVPSTIEELQDNYNKFEGLDLWVVFK